MTDRDAIVFVVDDDAPMRESLKNLIRSVGLRVEAYTSAQEFLRSKRPDAPGCLVLDVRMPGMNGLDLQRQIVEANWHIPIIFISSHIDGEARARALQAGAVDFLYKPFREEDLLNAIDKALKQSETKS